MRPADFEIHADPFAERDMILGREVELPRASPSAAPRHWPTRRGPRARWSAGYWAAPAAARTPAPESPRAAFRSPAAGRRGPRPRASKAAASWPLALACPTALALALRSARSRSASICTALRCSSRRQRPRHRARSRAAPARRQPRVNRCAAASDRAREFLPCESTPNDVRTYDPPAPRACRSRSRRAANASPILISSPRGAGT